MSEIRKRKKGQILNNNERQLILNLITYLKEKNSEKSISEIIREISKATGCSERTIYKIRKEASKGISVIVNRTRERKKENKNSRNVKYDSFVKSSIRKKVYNFFLQNVPPTLNAILNLVNNDPDLPNFKRSTLHTFLKEIGFIYEQKGKKSLLMEKPDVVQCRKQYLNEISRYRSENRWIIYTGETLVSLTRKDVKKKEKTDDPKEKEVSVIQPVVPMSCETFDAVFVNPTEIITGTALVYTIDASTLVNTIESGTLSTSENIVEVQGISDNTDNIPVHTIITADSLIMGESSQTVGEELENTKTEKRPITAISDTKKKSFMERELRFRIMHASTDRGFIEGADFVTLCKKKNDDIESYENWFIKKLLPKIPPHSVIVIDDNAPYHKKKEENIPEVTWKKQQIKNWLLSKNIKQIEQITQKNQLMAIVNKVRPMFSTKHKIQEAAKERGVIIMNLPAFHFELNPLNMIWPDIKYYIKSNMRSFKIKKIKELIKEGFYSTPQTNWLNYVNLMKETENLLCAVDALQESNSIIDSSQGTNEGSENQMSL